MKQNIFFFPITVEYFEKLVLLIKVNEFPLKCNKTASYKIGKHLIEFAECLSVTK